MWQATFSLEWWAECGRVEDTSGYNNHHWVRGVGRLQLAIYIFFLVVASALDQLQ